MLLLVFVNGCLAVCCEQYAPLRAPCTLQAPQALHTVTRVRVQDRVGLVGDAAGYVTKCSGEGIYFAAKSGRMCAEAIVAQSKNGTVMVCASNHALDSHADIFCCSLCLFIICTRSAAVSSACRRGRLTSYETSSLHMQAGEGAIREYLDKWDRKYWATYKVLDILQKLFYRSNPAREAFVEMCEDSYVQKMTFDSYLYKTVVPGNPLDDAKLLVNTVASIVRSNALRGAKGLSVSFGSKGDAERVEVASADGARGRGEGMPAAAK
jgi:geranylgeranyl diphosphate/geranylgeranyl-bacteriochlorophyllide a reductase